MRRRRGTHLIHEMLEVRCTGVQVVVEGVVGKGFPRRAITLNFDRVLDRAVMLNRTGCDERNSSHVDDVLQLPSILREQRQRERGMMSAHCQNLVP